MSPQSKNSDWTRDPSAAAESDAASVGEPLEDDTLAIDDSDLVDEKPLELDRAARESLEADVRRLTDEASQGGDAGRSALLLTHAGNLLAWRAHDATRATALFLAALERAPEFIPALRAARRLMLARHKFGPALDLYEREIAVAPDAESRATLHAEAALFGAARLGDFERAHLHLCRAMESTRVEGIAARELWRFLARVRDHRGLERHLTNWFESARQDRALVGFRLALMKEKRGERDRALELLLSLAARPGGLAPAILSVTSAIAGGLGRHHEESRALEDLAAHFAHHPAPEVAGLEVFLGLLAEERASDLAAAGQHYRRAISLAPNDAVARAALCDTLARERRLAKTSTEALALAEEAVGVAPEDTGAWLAVAEALEAVGEDNELAIAAYRRALTLDPAATDAQAGLGRLLARLGRTKETAELFVEQAARAATVDERAPLLYRAAEILNNQSAPGSGESALAIELFEEVLRLVPAYAPAQRALGAAYTRAERWSDLATLLDAEIATTRAVEHRVFLLDRLATIAHDRLRDPARAIAAYQRILTLSPANLGALRSLARLLAETGRWRDLVDVNLREVDLTTDRHQVAALLNRSGELLEERLNDVTSAIALYERVLVADPLHLPALCALGRLYTRTGNFRALYDMTTRELEAATRAPGSLESRRVRRIAILLRQGVLARDKLADNAAAAKAFRAVLAEDPLHPGAQSALLQLSKALGDSEAALTLSIEAWRRADGDKRTLLGLRAAVALLSRGDGDGAKRILVDSSMHAATQSLMAHLARVSGDWERAAQLSSREDSAWMTAFLEERPVEAARNLLAASRSESAAPVAGASPEICEMVLIESRALAALESLYARLAESADDPARARVFATLGARLARESAPSGGLEAEKRFLERLTAVDSANVQAWHRLADIARTRHDAEDLKVALERLVPFARDRAEKIAVLMELAQVSEVDLGSPDGAMSALEEIAAIAPDFVPAWESLERIATERGDWTGAAKAAEALGDALRDPGQSVITLKRAANLWMRKARDPARAADILVRAAARTDGADPELYTSLEETLRGLGDWARLVEVLTKNLEREATPEARRALLLKLAEVERRELHDRDTTLRHLREAVAIPAAAAEASPDSVVAAYREIALLEAERHEWARAIDAWEEVARQGGGGDAARIREALHAVATVYDERLHDPDQALEAFHRVLAREPGDKETLDRVARLFETRGDADNACRALERLLCVASSAEERAALELRLGRIFADVQLDLDAAREAVERALAADPRCSAAIQQLRAWAEKSGKPALWSAWVNAALRSAQSATSGSRAERARHLVSVAEVLRDQLQDPTRAAEQLRAALAIDESCREARVALFALLREREESRAEAIREGRRLLRRDRASEEVLGELVRLYDLAQEADHAHVFAAVLAGIAGDEKLTHDFPHAAEVCARNRKKPSVAILGSLSAPDRAQLLAHPAGASLLRSLLMSIAGALPKVFVADLTDFGVSKSSRVRDTSSLWDDVMRIADLVGTRAFHLYVAAHPSGRTSPQPLAAVVATSPASIVLSPEASDLIDTPRVRFWLGGAIEWVRGGLAALCGRTALEIEILCEALAFGAGEGRGTLVAPRETLERTWRIVNKELPRAVRREVPALVTNWLAHRNECSFDAFRVALIAAADRVGLIVAGDPTVALQETIHARNDDEAAADLVGYLASDEYFSLRRRLGIAIDG
jgi:tetratricopeptide (TPR) repeat protein